MILGWLSDDTETTLWWVWDDSGMTLKMTLGWFWDNSQIIWKTQKCQMSLGWLCDDTEMTLRWLLDDSYMTLRWLSNHFWKTLRWILDDSQIILGRLYDDSMMSLEWVLDVRFSTYLGAKAFSSRFKLFKRPRLTIKVHSTSRFTGYHLPDFPTKIKKTKKVIN